MYRTRRFRKIQKQQIIAVNHGSQSKSTDGSKSGWRQRSGVVVSVVLVVAMYIIVVGVVVALQ